VRKIAGTLTAGKNTKKPNIGTLKGKQTNTRPLSMTGSLRAITNSITTITPDMKTDDSPKGTNIRFMMHIRNTEEFIVTSRDDQLF
jgi:hypothetical protein